MSLEVKLLKKCKKCNVESNFVWDKDYFENSGKWRLYDQDTERPHQCQVKEPEPEKMVLCPYCNAQTRQKMSASKLQEHIKTAHLGFY